MTLVMGQVFAVEKGFAMFHGFVTDVDWYVKAYFTKSEIIFETLSLSGTNPYQKNIS